MAGVAALLVSLGLSGQAAAARIVATAAAGPGPTDKYGAGIVDAAAAVAGLGPPAPPPDPGDPGRQHGSFSTKRRVKRRAVRRHGFRVTCAPLRPGACSRRRRRPGAGSPAATATFRPTIGTRVSAELNRRGRRALKRMGERLRVRVVVTLPGEAARARRVTIRR